MPVKPLPRPNETTRPFWNGCEAGRFDVQCCRNCGHRQFPPRFGCTACHGTEFDWQTTSGAGTIFSYTVVHRAPLEAFKADVPYVLAIVELEEGARAMMNMRGIDPHAVRIGLPVEIFFEPTADGAAPLPQARPKA
jgi:uncharacterized OB-fold protein